MRCTAIVLAAGSGKRMGTKIHKQYLELAGKPVLYYSLHAFECAECIQDIILVTGAGEETYCKREIVDKFQFQKVRSIVAGGKERYHSVYQGLNQITESDYTFIHDGARPFLTVEMIKRAFEEVKGCSACVIGMPVKDTVKIADEASYVENTPPRNRVWTVQTPQVFSTSLIKEAYVKLMSSENHLITDDAMVVEQMLHHPIKLVEGSYRNIKITTPEDLLIAEAFFGENKKSSKI